MEKQFKQVSKLALLDEKHNNATLSNHLNKLAEEFGELAQSVNKIIGIKTIKKGETLKDIEDNINEEIVDCTQIMFAIAHLNNISYEEIISKFNLKNDKYELYIRKKTKIKKQKK